ncbi:MAG: hypothetical protein ACI4V1_00940 [Eubacteriales bacterium]
MKKCKKCGAVQSDSRSTCIDCGALLGKPMSGTEEAKEDAAIDDKLNGMAERTEDFYVSIPEKVMGSLCILGGVAAIVMLNLIGVEKTSALSPWYAAKLEKAGTAALISLFACLGAAPMLLVPRFMWFLDTLSHRLWYSGWDFSPTFFAIVVRKIMAYGLFAAGMVGGIYSYCLYFG